jgi:hypothetical protein
MFSKIRCVNSGKCITMALSANDGVGYAFTFNSKDGKVYSAVSVDKQSV